MPPRVFINRNKRAKEFFAQMIRGQTRERVMVITDSSPYRGGTGKTILGHELEIMARQANVKPLSVDCRTQRESTINQFELMHTILLDLDPSLERFHHFNALDRRIRQRSCGFLAASYQEGTKPTSGESDQVIADFFRFENVERTPVVIAKRDLFQLVISGIVSDDTLQRDRYEQRRVYQKTFLNELALYASQEGGIVLFLDRIDCRMDLQEWVDTFCTLLGKDVSPPLYLVLMGGRDRLPDLGFAKALGQAVTFELDWPSTSEKDFIVNLVQESFDCYIPYAIRRQIREPGLSFHEVWGHLDRCWPASSFQDEEFRLSVQFARVS